MEKITERPILFSGEMVRQVLAGNKTQTRRVAKYDHFVPKRMQGDYDFEVFMRINPAYLREPILYESCPYGKPGDLLWLKESFYIDHLDFSEGGKLPKESTAELLAMTYYPADARQDRPHWCCQMIPECACHEVGKPKARSGRFMPRWASRITLEITNVRVERLQDISEEDAKAEGVYPLMSRSENPSVARAFSPQHGSQVNPTFSTIPDLLHGHRGAFASLWDKINGAKFPWSSNPWVWILEFRKLDTE